MTSLEYFEFPNDVSNYWLESRSRPIMFLRLWFQRTASGTHACRSQKCKYAHCPILCFSYDLQPKKTYQCYINYPHLVPKCCRWTLIVKHRFGNSLQSSEDAVASSNVAWKFLGTEDLAETGKPPWQRPWYLLQSPIPRRDENSRCTSLWTSGRTCKNVEWDASASRRVRSRRADQDELPNISSHRSALPESDAQSKGDESFVAR